MKFNISQVSQGGGGNPTKLYNDKKEPIPLSAESIPKGAKIDLIVEMGAVYMIGKKNLGITWRAPQIRIKEMGDKLADYAFVDSDDEDEPIKLPLGSGSNPLDGLPSGESSFSPNEIIDDALSNVVV